jgi:hypothetical protein
MVDRLTEELPTLLTLILYTTKKYECKKIYIFLTLRLPLKLLKTDRHSQLGLVADNYSGYSSILGAAIRSSFNSGAIR